LKSFAKLEGMQRENFEQLSRKELQQLAKEHGLKANKKSIELILELSELFSSKNNSSVMSTPIQSIESPNDAPIEPLRPMKPIEQPHLITSQDNVYAVSDQISFTIDSMVNHGTIKRVNKLSIRVIMDNGSELTVQNSCVLGLYCGPETESSVSLDENLGDNQDKEVEETSEVAAEEEAEEETETNIAEDPRDESTVCENEISRQEIEVAEDPSAPKSPVTQTLSSAAISLMIPSPILEREEEAEVSINVVTEPESQIDSNEPAVTEIREFPEVSDLLMQPSLFAHTDQFSFPMTPKTKFDNRRRSSLMKSTKAQRARAEAIALKKERLSVACSNTQLSFLKSPHPVQHSKENRPNLVTKKVSDVRQRSLSTSRASLVSSASTSTNLKKSKTTPTTRVSVSTPIQDRIARIQEAKEKANSYLRSTSTSQSKVPNFNKLHEQTFKKQKSIASLAKEVFSPFSFSVPHPLPEHNPRDPHEDDGGDECRTRNTGKDSQDGSFRDEGPKHHQKPLRDHSESGVSHLQLHY
jgi:hypothetical protein